MLMLSISHTYMLKIATINDDMNLLLRVKGHKKRVMWVFFATHIQTTSLHHFQPYGMLWHWPLWRKISGQSNISP